MNKDFILEAAESLEEISKKDQSASFSLMQQRRLLESIYKNLLADSGLSFSGLFPRMQYYHDNYDTPRDIVDSLNSLRILANKAVHEADAVITEEQALAGLKSIYTLLKHLDDKLALPELEKRLESVQEFAAPKQSARRSFRCIVKECKHHINGGRIAGLEILAIDDEQRDVSILLRDDRVNNNKKMKYSLLLPSFWEYANLACHQLTEVKGRDGYYIDNPQTIVVLEPDFLVDASSIAECITGKGFFPELFILGHLGSESGSDKMLLGRMVNSIFDDLIQEEDGDYLELFKRGLESMPIPMVAQGAQVAMDIYKIIEDTHLEKLKEYAVGMKGKSYLLEPSFLCPSYGLQGRLDLIFEERNKYSIVELKSGSSPNYDVWNPHRYQVVAYNMILRSAYGAQNIANSSIFYSSAKDNNVRNVQNMPILEQNLINVRNRIVGILKLISTEPQRFFDWVLRQNADAYESFHQTRFKKLQALIGSLQAHEYEWFCEQLKRVVREIWQVKAGSQESGHDYGHSALWNLSASEKEGKIIPHLKIEKSDGTHIWLHWEDQLPITDFRSSDVVIFYDEAKGVERQEIIRGVIEDMDKENIVLRVRGGISRKFDSKSLWAIEHDVLESFLYSPMSSLISFLESTQDKRDLLLGLREPKADELTSDDAEEKENVLKRMKAADELFIVQGPPGTGKTSGLIGKYIEDFYHQSNKVMMVLSFTNRAVDEICGCLQDRNIPFIRTGNSRGITDELLHKLIRGKRYLEIEKIIADNRIFVASVQSANAWYKDLQRIITVDEILVDEASQILENQILGVLSSCPKCIFIGDQNQLPAISVQDNIRYSFKEEKLQALNYDDTNQSLMGRLFRVYETRGWDRHIHMLRNHYRMHEDIAGLIADYYDHKLEAQREAQKEPLMLKDLPHPFDKRLIWIDCPPSEDDYYDSKMSEGIVRLVKKMQDLGIIKDSEKDLGIVAPYRAMIHLIKKDLDDITVDTVERYQGSERSVMILAFPLRSRRGIRSLQSLSSDGEVDRKLNVALSRAKERLIVMANKEICLDSIHYRNLFEQISSQGAILRLQDLEF